MSIAFLLKRRHRTKCIAGKPAYTYTGEDEQPAFGECRCPIYFIGGNVRLNTKEWQLDKALAVATKWSEEGLPEKEKEDGKTKSK